MSPLEERRLHVDGHELRMLVGGEGAPLVVLLASPVIDAGLYRRTADAFAAVSRVAVVDLPGSGKASRVASPLGMQALSDFVPGLLAAMDAPSAVLVGHSNSGPIALLAAVRHPEKVAGLVLVDATGAHPGRSLLPVIAGRTLDAGLEPRLTVVGIPAVVRNLVRHPRQFISQIRSAAGDGWVESAQDVAVPTLLAWGARDHTMPRAAMERYRSAIGHARAVVSQTGSHDWIIEQPQRFAGAVLEWMAQLRPDRIVASDSGRAKK